MSHPGSLVPLMAGLPPTKVDTEAVPMPMDRSKAKALGLKVYPSHTYCRRSSKHDNMRRVSNNQCVQCAELEARFEQDMRAKVLDKLKAEAERKVRKEMAALIADAEKQAAAILKDAQREAMDKAKQLEKAKATREANKAAKAAAAPTPSAGPVEPVAGALGASVGLSWEGLEDDTETSASGLDVAPWD
jgi:hypothetical protein